MTGAAEIAPSAAQLRPPSEVMRLARMGAAFPTRLSFMRVLIRRLALERAEVRRARWEMDDQGYGRAVYSVALGGRVYSLCAFANPLDPAQRTDRVIAEAWDAAFVLYDGEPSAAELDRLAAAAPLQEAARFAETDLVLSRANKSLRLFEHVAESLAAGRQPDPRRIVETGYLMRTTAVYGNGKFGIADRARIAERPGLSGPFAVEMLTVWLIRGFTHDLVEHVAAARGGARAARLDPALRRHLGVGNATGLGMAPFLVSHPILLDAWMRARETALSRVRAQEAAAPETAERFRALLERVRAHLAEWRVEDARQSARIAALEAELAQLAALASPALLAGPRPWDRLARAVEDWSLEAQELVAALLIEPHGPLVDHLATTMATDATPRLDPAMTLGALRAALARGFDWALGIDFDAPQATALFWYVSEEKLEPRLGRRREEAGAEREGPLDIARQAQALAAALAEADPTEMVAALALRRPDLRHVISRVQALSAHPYAEIRDNLIGEGCLPIDMLRCKLAFFGAAKFDPKSDLWTRITMFQGAPCRDQLSEGDPDDWAFAALSA